MRKTKVYANTGIYKGVSLVCIAAMLFAAMLSGCSGQTADQPEPSAAATPEPVETAVHTPTPSPAATPEPSPTQAPTPSPTPAPTATPEPVATPEPSSTPAQASASFGVFIGLNPEEITRLAGYGTVVIDAAYFSAEDIQAMHSAGQKVYSYLNIGSVEEFRDYYEAFKRSTLGAYENWPDERWVDVANPKWQEFVVNNLAATLVAKGVDGFFLDNADVYYVYHREEIYQGLVAILSGLGGHGRPLIINGGDVFVRELAANGQAGLIAGVNQECVFTSIDFDTGTYGVQDAETHQYYSEYLALCKGQGLKGYLTEYAADPGAVEQGIADYCAQNGFSYYIATSLELN